MFVSALRNGNEMTEEFAYAGIYLIMVAWGLNIGSSLLITVIEVIEKLRDCRKKKKVMGINNTDVVDFTVEDKNNSKSLD